jgi:hypothetical protein
VAGICKKVRCIKEDILQVFQTWKNRYFNDGIDGLRDLSRVPRASFVLYQVNFLRALTEEIQIVDAKRIMVTKTTKLSGL